MRLLLINPNTSQFVTTKAVEVARAFASSGTVVQGVTGAFGAPIINSEADLAVGAYSALELAARHGSEFDAVGLAVSFDCGLQAVREILDVPVVGLAEASVRDALQFGDRFSVVSFAERTRPLYTRLIRQYADATQLRKITCISSLTVEVLKDADQLRRRAEEAVADMVQHTRCSSVILLATAFAGLRLDPAIGTPVVDCVAALVKCLEECVSNPNVGELFRSPVFPERKLMPGVSDELADCYRHFPQH